MRDASQFGSFSSSIHTMVSSVGRSSGASRPSSCGIHAPLESTSESAAKLSSAQFTVTRAPSLVHDATDVLIKMFAPCCRATSSAARIVASGRTNPPRASNTASQSRGTSNCVKRRMSSPPSSASTLRSCFAALESIPAHTRFPGAPPMMRPFSVRSSTPLSRASRSNPRYACLSSGT